MAKKATRLAYGEELAELIVKDERVVALTADLAGSNMTSLAQKACPERHFDCGIAEANMVAMSAGMAACGMIPFASSFAIFEAGRAYEQVRNSVAYPHLNVKLCATHAGISVGEDGASHQSISDLALMRGLPNMTVLQPCDAVETKRMIDWAYRYDGPVYIRLSRAGVEDVHDESYAFQVGKMERLKDGKDAAILATGIVVQEALKAREALLEKGIDAAVWNVPSIKPFDAEAVARLAERYSVLYTVEEHSIIGGLGSAAAEVMAQAGRGRLVRIGLNDTFGESGKPGELFEKYGISAAAIEKRVLAGK